MRGLIVFVIAVIYIAFCFFAHSYYRKPLWDLSINSLIPWLQKQPDWIHTGFSWTFWGLEKGIWVWLFAFYAFFNRASSIYLFSSCMILGILQELLKVYYRDGRPFYMSEGIRALDCTQSNFGRPDGHIFSVATVLTLIFLSYFDPHDIRGSAELLYRNRDGSFDDTDKKDTQHNKNRNSALFFGIWAFLLGLLVVLGWICELMTGSNSLDQLIFGSTLCVGFSLFWYLLRDEITMFYLRVSEHVYELHHKIRIVVFFLAGVIIFFGIMYGSRTFIINAFNKMDDVPPEWVLAFEKQCGKPASPHWFYFHLRNIYQYSLFFGGIVLGVTFDSLVLGGTIVLYNKTNEEEYPIKGIV